MDKRKQILEQALEEASDHGINIGPISGRMVRKAKQLFDIDLDELALLDDEVDVDELEGAALKEYYASLDKYYDQIMRAVFTLCEPVTGMSREEAVLAFEAWADATLIDVKVEFIAMKAFMAVWLEYRIAMAEIMGEG